MFRRRTWFAARYVVRTSSIMPPTIYYCTPCTAASRTLRNPNVRRHSALYKPVHCTCQEYLTSHGTFESHGRGYMLSRRYGRSETCPPQVRLHMWQQQIVMGTATAAHYTADDTGRDEVKSEHVPLPTGGIGRRPLVPLQSERRSGRRPTA